MTDSDAWGSVGRDLAVSKIDDHRFAIESALSALVETIERGDNVEAKDILEARRALRRAQHFNEEQLAVLAGVDPWDGALSRVPYGAIYRTLGYRPTDGEPIES